MNQVLDYLQIPEDYCAFLGGLRWSSGGDAIEFPSGHTFAFNREIALFVEGFSGNRGLIHFGFILHLMHLVASGRLTHGKATLVGGQCLRNAGAFCAILSDGVPRVPDPPEFGNISRQLTSGAVLVDQWSLIQGRRTHFVISTGGDLPTPVEPRVGPPPLSPSRFERQIFDALKAYTPDEIRHWLRHGRGPIKAAAQHLAEAIEASRPKTISEVLEPLVARPRLGGSARLIAHLTGALTLPPRKLAAETLPVGGYADVATRGQPERLLPSQYALDGLEFLRRFAEHELLYFHREDPHLPDTDELVVLLDQGVRTWGDVRIALGAAVLALGRLADRRKLPFRLAATSNDGQLIDPIEADPQTLGELLEASDLSFHPGEALERVLQTDGAALRRDVIILSHPRSLATAEVEASARAAPEGTRLFTLAVDARGEVRFDELRHGRPLKLSRFQIDLSEGSAPAASTHDAPADPAEPSRRPAWTGDVEPIGFPFCFGLVGARPRSHPRFDFDGSGKWFLVVGPRGMLHAWTIDGRRAEVLPRGYLLGEVLRDVEAVLGVKGGFVIGGRIDGRLVAVHYDFQARHARVFQVGDRANLPWEWTYFQEAHAVVAWTSDWLNGWCLDLATAETDRFSAGVAPELPSNGQLFNKVLSFSLAPPALLVLHDQETLPTNGPWVRLRRETGTILLHGVEPPWRPFRPLADGRPMLQNCRVQHAFLRGNTLALVVNNGTKLSRLLLFRGPEVTLLRVQSLVDPTEQIALSPDGQWLARPLGSRQFQIESTAQPSQTTFITSQGGTHSQLRLAMGHQWLAIQVGRYANLIRWDRGRLTVEPLAIPSRGQFVEFLQVLGTDQRIAPLQAVGGPSLPHEVHYDSKRFTQTCRGELTALVDVFGQIALFDGNNSLIAMLFSFQGQVAAWLPDGTRLGPSHLIGGPATPGAAKTIGRALLQARPAQVNPESLRIMTAVSKHLL